MCSAENKQTSKLLAKQADKQTNVHPPKIKNQAIFFRSLAIAAKSGIPFLRALQVSSNEPIVLKLIDLIKKGHTFSSALSSYPSFFSQYTIAMVQSGEQDGRIPDVLERIAKNIEESEALLRYIKNALIYPAFILAISIIMVFVLVKFMMPQFLDLLKSLNVPLPASTHLLMNIISLLTGTFFWIVFAVITVIFVWVLRHIKTPEGKEIFDQVLLSIPVIRDVIINIGAARFTLVLGDLFVSGIKILQALYIAGKVVNNAVIEKEIQKAIVYFSQEGVLLSRAISEHVTFPKMVSEMIFVGEQTGELDKILLKVSQYCKTAADSKIEFAQTLIEPMVMVVLGIVVGFFMVSFFVPIYAAVSGMGG